MLRVGRISDIDADNARVKVSFGADGVTTGWLQTIHAGSSGNSYFHTYAVNETVAVLLESDGIYGFVIGAVYSGDVTPTESGSKIVSVAFPNGDKVIYNGTTGEMELKASGGITITGDLVVTGDVKAGVLQTSLTTHVHTVAGVQVGSGSVTSNTPT